MSKEYINSQAIKEVISKMKGKVKELTNDEACELYDNNNVKYLNSNPENNSSAIKTIEDNILYTPDNLQNIYWFKMLQIIDSISKKNISCNYPKLSFGKALSDTEFLDLFKLTVDYASYSQSEYILNLKKKELKTITSNVENIFSFPKILKNVKENGFLHFVMAETKNEREESIELIKVKNTTLTPLVNIPFNINGKNYDLNKEELKQILTSNVLVNFYKKNLRNFIPKFDEKIRNNAQLIQHIIFHLDNYNIYFCHLPQKIMAITIHTGDIYLKSDYIKEYYNNKNNKGINKDDYSIIIREKIVLNIKHELNHILIREIDIIKKENFFLKSENSDKKNKMLDFKDKFSDSKIHSFPNNESGDCFDFSFYKGYYFDNLLKREADFFLEVKEMKDDNEYNLKFNEMMKITEKNKDEIVLGSIHKFKKCEEEHPRCFKSRVLDGNN